MKCEDVRALLGPFFDDEIGDPLLSQRVAEHLETCEACSQAMAAMTAVSRSLRGAPPRFQASQELKRRIEMATGVASGQGPAVTRGPGWRQRFLVQLLPWGTALGCVAIVFILVTRSSGRFGEELVADHVRSLQANHLFDVPSSDKHTVKPWFQGRLDFSPDVPDLTSNGFPLLGGRLDYVAHRPAAAIVYGRGKHIINVLVTKHLGGNTPSGVEDRNGYHLVGWAAFGLDYWAVSDVNPADLVAFREAFLGASSSGR